MGPATLTVWAILIAIGLFGAILIGTALRPRRTRPCPDAKCHYANPRDAHYCARCGQALPPEGPRQK